MKFKLFRKYGLNVLKSGLPFYDLDLFIGMLVWDTMSLHVKRFKIPP